MTNKEKSLMILVFVCWILGNIDALLTGYAMRIGVDEANKFLAYVAQAAGLSVVMTKIIINTITCAVLAFWGTQTGKNSINYSLMAVISVQILVLGYHAAYIFNI